MKYIRDYTKSPCPNFDAVEDIRDYLGDRYDNIYGKISKYNDPEVFAMICSLFGIHGFPVRAWYDHIHGGGEWDQRSSKEENQ